MEKRKERKRKKIKRWFHHKDKKISERSHPEGGFGWSPNRKDLKDLKN